MPEDVALKQCALARRVLEAAIDPSVSTLDCLNELNDEAKRVLGGKKVRQVLEENIPNTSAPDIAESWREVNKFLQLIHDLQEEIDRSDSEALSKAIAEAVDVQQRPRIDVSECRRRIEQAEKDIPPHAKAVLKKIKKSLRERGRKFTTARERRTKTLAYAAAMTVLLSIGGVIGWNLREDGSEKDKKQRVTGEGDRKPILKQVTDKGKEVGGKVAEVVKNGGALPPIEHKLPQSEPPASEQTNNYHKHIIKEGETYSSISRLHGVPVATLREDNGIPDKELIPGNALNIRVTKPVLVKPPKRPLKSVSTGGQ